MWPPQEPSFGSLMSPALLKPSELILPAPILHLCQPLHSASTTAALHSHPVLPNSSVHCSLALTLPSGAINFLFQSIQSLPITYCILTHHPILQSAPKYTIAWLLVCFSPLNHCFHYLLLLFALDFSLHQIQEKPKHFLVFGHVLLMPFLMYYVM